MQTHTLLISRPLSAPRPDDTLAYALFRSYADAIVAAGYPKPEIRNESDLVRDLHDTLDDALEAVKRKKDKHHDFEYMVGYASGYVLGQLREAWRGTYLLPHAPEYKTKIALDKALGLIQRDGVFTARLQALYEGHFNVSDDDKDPDGLRLTNVAPTIPEKHVPILRTVDMPATDRAFDVLNRLRSDLIAGMFDDDAYGREVKLIDPDDRLESFISKWITYAVNGVVFTEEANGDAE